MIDIVKADHLGSRLRAHRLDLLAWAFEASAHRGGEAIDVAGGYQPSVLVGLNQFRYARNERADDRGVAGPWLP
ncbi:hypothetical protein ACVWYK_005440 [Bradyrhizobium sp. USDA 4470]